MVQSTVWRNLCIYCYMYCVCTALFKFDTLIRKTKLLMILMFFIVVSQVTSFGFHIQTGNLVLWPKNWIKMANNKQYLQILCRRGWAPLANKNTSLWAIKTPLPVYLLKWWRVMEGDTNWSFYLFGRIQLYL